jgi:sigma-B regulation protein RsbU (phosphoserine phosphatase)
MDSVVTPSASSTNDAMIRAIFLHAARIGREQQIDELVRLNADFARDLAGADRCSLWLIDPVTRELWTKVSHGVDSIRIPFGDGLVGACIREDQVVLVNDASAETRLMRQVDRNSGYHTEQVLCVPMHADGRVIGALQLLNKSTGFTETDAGLLGLLAHFAANAIESERLRQESESARLLRHELSLAHDVQVRLLPQDVPAFPGVSMAAMCRPARTVGGDYYDFIPLDEHRLAFTLGDVAGKGIAAAVMMASIQTLLRSLLQGFKGRRQPSLEQTVEQLNRALFESSAPERYSTLFCGLLDLPTRQLTYINAGQVKPILLRADGSLEELPEGGCPVGLLPSFPWQQATVTMSPGDCLLVVSDGMMEPCNRQGDFWDEAELGRLLKAYGDKPLAGLPDALIAGADAWAAGAEQFDDMTVVALRVDAI